VVMDKFCDLEWKLVLLSYDLRLILLGSDVRLQLADHGGRLLHN
jgi:hypothetical protein